MPDHRTILHEIGAVARIGARTSGRIILNPRLALATVASLAEEALSYESPPPLADQDPPYDWATDPSPENELYEVCTCFGRVNPACPAHGRQIPGLDPC